MNEEYIFGLAIASVIALIGIIYKILSGNVASNTKEIKRVDDDTDKRIDNVELDIREIQTKIDK